MSPQKRRTGRTPHPYWARYCQLSAQLRELYGPTLAAIILTHRNNGQYEGIGLIAVSSVKTILEPAEHLSPDDIIEELWELLGEGDWLLADAQASAAVMRCSPSPVTPTIPPLPWARPSVPQESPSCPMPPVSPPSSVLSAT